MSNPSISRSCQAVLKKVASISLFSSMRRDSRCAAYQVSSWQKTCQLNGSHNRQTYMSRMDPYGSVWILPRHTLTINWAFLLLHAWSSPALRMILCLFKLKSSNLETERESIFKAWKELLYVFEAVCKHPQSHVTSFLQFMITSL